MSENHPPAEEREPAEVAPRAEGAWWCRSSGPAGGLRWLAEDFAGSFAAIASTLLRSDLAVHLAAVAESSRAQFARSLEEPTCSYVLSDAGAGGPAATGRPGPGASEPRDGVAPRGAPNPEAQPLGWLGMSDAAFGAAEDAEGPPDYVPEPSPARPAAGRPPTEVHLEFSPGIAMAMVECMLGAPAGRPGVPPRPLTPAERRVLHSLAEVAAASLSTAWPGGDKPRLAAEHAPAPLAVQADEEPVAVITFQLAFAGHLGTLRLCAPVGAVEGAIPPRRARRFGDAPLELTAAVEGIMLDEADLAGLAAGDILATDTPVDGEVILRIGGIPKFAARLRSADGRKALTITRRLDGPEAR